MLRGTALIIGTMATSWALNRKISKRAKTLTFTKPECSAWMTEPSLFAAFFSGIQAVALTKRSWCELLCPMMMRKGPARTLLLYVSTRDTISFPSWRYYGTYYLLITTSGSVVTQLNIVIYLLFQNEPATETYFRYKETIIILCGTPTVCSSAGEKGGSFLLLQFDRYKQNNIKRCLQQTFASSTKKSRISNQRTTPVLLTCLLNNNSPLSQNSEMKKKGLIAACRNPLKFLIQPCVREGPKAFSSGCKQCRS